MPITAKTEAYKKYGKVLAISNGAFELKVTLDIGPRVIYCALKDGENIMFNDDAGLVKKTDARYEAAFGTGKVWRMYGGHRLWFSPEDDPLSYYPEDEPVSWTQEKDTFIFTPPLQRTTEFQFSLEITPDKRRAAVKVNHVITNKSGGIRRIAPWALSVLAPGGLAFVPQPAEDTGLLSNREIVLWPYSNMADSRVYWGRDFITLKSVSQTPDGAFKLGLNNTACVAAYLLNKTAFVKRYSHNPKGVYPDRGVSFETFTNEHFIEIESLGELSDLNPGEKCEHEETWRLFKIGRVPAPKNELSLKKLAAKIFK